MLHYSTWKFPKMEVPPNSCYFNGFSIVQLWGTPIDGNHILLQKRGSSEAKAASKALMLLKSLGLWKNGTYHGCPTIETRNV